MLRKNYLISLLFLLVLSGCLSSKKGNKTSVKNPYERPSLIEIPEQRLELDAMLIDAKLQKELGFFDKAFDLYTNILEKDSTYTVAWFDIGELYFSKRDFEKAIVHTQKAIQLNPDNIWYRLQLAEIYMQLYQFKNSARELENIVKLSPNESSYYFEWANVLLLAEDPEGAIQVYTQLEKKIGPSDEISEQKQKIWNSIGKQDKIIEENEKLVKQYPNEIKYNAVLAEIYMSQKKYDKAFTYYSNIKRIAPENKYINVSLAEYYKAVGKQQQAFQSLKEAFQNKELEMNAKIQILVSFYPIEDFYKTYKTYTFELVKLLYDQDTNHVRILPLYGDVMLRSDNYREAVNAFQKLINIDSSLYEVHEALLMSASYLNDTALLLTQSEKTIRLFPTQPLPYYFNGVSYYQKKEFFTALDVFQKGVRWVVDDEPLLSSFYSLIGECYHELKEEDQMGIYFDKALKIDSNNMGLLNNYAYYLSVSKTNLQKAENMSKKTILKNPKNPTFLDTYAWILFQMSNYADALKYMQMAIEEDKEPSGIVLEHYADILFKNNKVEEAKKYWNEALKKGDGTEKLKEKVEKGIWVE